MIKSRDDGIWDEFVERHPHGWISHLSGWKRVISRAFPHMKGHFLAIRRNGTIQAALPVYEVSSWLTGRRLVSIPHATLSDPLVASAGEFTELLGQALALAGSTGSKYLEIRTLAAQRLIEDGRLGVSRLFKHHHLLLSPGPEKLMKSFDRTCVRQRISRGQKSGIGLRTVEDAAGVGEFYRLYLLTRKRLGLPPQPYLFIRSLWETFAPAGLLEIQLAEHAGRAVAGILLLKYKGRVSAEFMVSDEAYRDLSPNHLLFWEAIRRAHREGYGVFDFGRTAESNTSLMTFKSRWGAIVSDLPCYYYPGRFSETCGMKKSPRAYKAMALLCRKMPGTAFATAGKFCYRHLG